MEAKFSPRVKEVIQYSREEAIRLGHGYIGTEHLLLGIIREGEGKALLHLKNLGVDLLRLKKSIEDNIQDTSAKTTNLGNIPLTKQAEKALKITYLEAKIFKADIIGTEHLLLSILREEDNLASSILNQYGIDYDVLKESIENNGADVRADMSTDSPKNSTGRRRKAATPKEEARAKHLCWIISDGISRSLRNKTNWIRSSVGKKRSNG